MTATATTSDPAVTALDTTTTPGQFVGMYVLRPVVGVNLNAGMDGAPKQITVGNARRLRVSSQALKRAMREWTHQLINRDEQAVRTRKLPGAVAEHLADARGIDYQEALAAVAALILGAGKFTIRAQTPHLTQEIVFTPRNAVTALSQLAADHWDELAPAAQDVGRQIGEAAEFMAKNGKKKGEKTQLSVDKLPNGLKKQTVAAFAPGASTEIALNGRMLTALPDTGAIEAAMSVAHAYSVDPVTLTVDEWTAKDDWQDGGFEDDSAGASMLDTRTLSSGTLFQWAALDRHQLRANLAATSGLAGDDLDEAAKQAEQLFVASAAWAVPGASGHTTGSQVAPAFAVATVGDTPPLTPPVFEEAITENIPRTAADRLGQYLSGMQRLRPINGGAALWAPGLPSQPPALPEGVSVESIW